MAATLPIRITEDRATALLRQCKAMLIVCIVSFILLCADFASKNKQMDAVFVILFAIYWLTGVCYFIWLGRLAYGLRRSVVYYVGGTWLLSSGVFLLAHIIAYGNISRQLKKSINTFH